MTKDLKNEKQCGELKMKLSNLANTYVNNYRPLTYVMKKHGILKRLRKNNDIVILQPDKGDGTVIKDRDVYIRKIFEIIKDRAKFKELSTDPAIITEGQLQRFFLLKPVISTTHCTKDSFSFCEEIKKVRTSNKFLVFYDVCSLFTSIPLAETIDIAVDLLFEKNFDFKISKADLRKLVQFATSGTHFTFEGKFYDQIDDAAMGSPLRPVLANLFMGYHEQKWLQSFEKCVLVLYRRYVDDIICLFNSESDADNFYVFLNQRQPKIKSQLKNKLKTNFHF